MIVRCAVPDRACFSLNIADLRDGADAYAVRVRPPRPHGGCTGPVPPRAPAVARSGDARRALLPRPPPWYAPAVEIASQPCPHSLTRARVLSPHAHTPDDDDGGDGQHGTAADTAPQGNLNRRLWKATCLHLAREVRGCPFSARAYPDECSSICDRTHDRHSRRWTVSSGRCLASLPATSSKCCRCARPGRTTCGRTTRC